MSKIRQAPCEACGELTPSHEIISLGVGGSTYRQLCGQCFNAEVARLKGLGNFESFRIEPITLRDCAGEAHDFHFRTRLLGHVVAMDAFELRDGEPSGYQCEVADDPDADLLGLLGRLVEKLRRMLAVKHLTVGEPEPQIAEQTVRGRIDWDESVRGRTPLLVIDGQEVTWEEFGRMMATFEGWQFRLELIDRCDEA